MAVVSFCIFVVVVLKLWSIKPQIPVKFILQEFIFILVLSAFFQNIQTLCLYNLFHSNKLYRWYVIMTSNQCFCPLNVNQLASF
jgi:hypothetical protein